MSISVVINTCNSAAHLDRVLESVKDFNETIVCDMGSTDDTVEIARRHGARVVSFPKQPGNIKEPGRNFAIAQARCDYVLVINDDELATPELRRYLYKHIHGANPASALYIPRRNYILDRFRVDAYPDYNLRFFEQENVDWPPTRNSKPVVKGRVDKVPSNKRELALVHIPYSVSEMLGKIDYFTGLGIDKEEPERVTLLALTFKPLYHFIRVYFLLGAWRYGIPGFIGASNEAVYRLYRMAKMYERHHAAKIRGVISDVAPLDIDAAKNCTSDKK
jgi:glycosyltransferase involved in cell wall biosynthesis